MKRCSAAVIIREANQNYTEDTIFYQIVKTPKVGQYTLMERL